jgi:hypothetical protein
MKPIPFERDVLEQTDEELGKTLVAYWLSILAHRAGIEDQAALKDFAVNVVKRTADMDGDSVEFAALESIYRKACWGEYAVAGRMFRDFVVSDENLFDLRELAKIGAPVREGRKIGARKGAATNKAKAAPEHKSWVNEARRCLNQGASKRHVASDVAGKFGVSSHRVRTVLQQHGVLEKRK